MPVMYHILYQCIIYSVVHLIQTPGGLSNYCNYELAYHGLLITQRFYQSGSIRAQVPQPLNFSISKFIAQLRHRIT